MNWTPLEFSEHRGKTLPQVLFADPYFFFLHFEKNSFYGKYTHQAKEIHRKACSILVPKDCDEYLEWICHLKVVYFFTHDNVFINFRIVPAFHDFSEKNRKCFYLDVIDFSMVRRSAPPQQLKYRTFLKTFKRYIFKDENYIMNKEECESFFENEDNFASELQPRRKPKGMFDDQLKKLNWRVSLEPRIK